MKEFFNNIFSDKIMGASFLGSLFFIALSFLVILFSYHKLPPFIPIFNQLPWGTQRIGTTITIFIPVSISLLISITNLIFSISLYKKTPLMSRILSVTSLILSILVFLFIIKIIFLIL